METFRATLFKCWRCKAALRVEAGLKEAGPARPRAAAEAEKRVQAIWEGAGTVSAPAGAGP
eukprot:434156-Lingulodinium_polyedra.AAC.1